MTLEVLATIALCVLALEMVVFMVTYVGGSPWWATPLGRIYAAKTVLMTLVLLQNAASVLTDSEYPGRHPLRLAIYAGGATAMVALWGMLRRYQRQGRAARAATGDTRSRWRVWVDILREWAAELRR